MTGSYSVYRCPTCGCIYASRARIPKCYRGHSIPKALRERIDYNEGGGCYYRGLTADKAGRVVKAMKEVGKTAQA